MNTPDPRRISFAMQQARALDKIGWFRRVTTRCLPFARQLAFCWLSAIIKDLEFLAVEVPFMVELDLGHPA